MRSTVERARWIALMAVTVGTVVGVCALGGIAHAQPGASEVAPGILARGPGGPGGPPGGPGGPGPGGPGPMGDFAPPRPPGLPPQLRFPPPEAFDALDLSDSQRARIDALGDKVRRASIRAEADIRIAEIDLEDLLAGDEVTDTALDDAIGHLEELRTSLLRTHAKAILAMRPILTSQQRAKLKRPAAPRWH